jgi:hypothetical protein
VVEIKVTPQMSSKWVKAGFLILLGIVLLYYHSGFIDDLERNSAEEFNLSFEWTWDLLQVLMWILIAWLFVYAALIIALSFRMDYCTLNDVMAKLSSIEKRLPAQRTRTPVIVPAVEPIEPEVFPVEEFEEADELDEEEPPPPTE